MAHVPSKRLLVYVIAGAIVLLVGTIGVVAMRDDPDHAGILEGQVLAAVGSDSTGEDAVLGAAAQESDSTGQEAAAVTSSTTTAIYVQVAGAVRRPGVYQVPADARVFQAVMEAGGFTEEADQQALTLAARVTDGCRIYVPRIGETVEGPLELVSPGSGSGSEESTGIVSLNSATLEQLDSLPGIGPAIAQDIITYREANGPFTSVDQLTDVPGIGSARLEQLRPLVGL